ncbi:MAG TPA: hypothetical protein VI959_00825 [Alphaproteobacteria bacterium]|nr:hypothetical protein [Alphaproteobacteria bacterium]
MALCFFWGGLTTLNPLFANTLEEELRLKKVSISSFNMGNTTHQIILNTYLNGELGYHSFLEQVNVQTILNKMVRLWQESYKEIAKTIDEEDLKLFIGQTWFWSKEFGIFRFFEDNDWKLEDIEGYNPITILTVDEDQRNTKELKKKISLVLNKLVLKDPPRLEDCHFALRSAAKSYWHKKSDTQAVLEESDQETPVSERDFEIFAFDD